MMLIQSFKLLYLKYWIEKGFFGAKLFITKPFSSDYERQEFESTIQDLKGSENSSVLLLEANLESDNLAEHILIQNIDTNIDDTLFQSTEESSARNIRKAFGVPSILLEDSDNSIFGNSGELLTQAKQMHWENKAEERSIIIDAFQMLFSNFILILTLVITGQLHQ
jgi:capsid portal protein